MKFIDFCNEYLSDVSKAPAVLDAMDVFKYGCGDVLLDPIDIFINNLSSTSLGKQIDKAYRDGYGEKVLHFAFDNADMEMDDLAKSVSRYLGQLQNQNCTQRKPIVLELFEKYSNQ